MRKTVRTTPRVLGLSHDGRTQRWAVECPLCGGTFTPQTTRLAIQEFDCPNKKCKAVLLANYNAEPPTVTGMVEDDQ